MMTRLMILFLLVAALGGCGSLGKKDQAERLSTSLNQYAAALRWDRHAQAHSFHISRDNKQPVFDRGKMEQYSVTSYKILEQSVNPEVTEANLYVEISYYDEHEGTLKSIREKQFWWYKEEIKRWFTEAEMPDFK